MNPKMSFGQLIVRLRAIHGMSQETLAERCSMTTKSISKLERDLCDPNFRTIIKLAAAFEMKPYEFFKEMEESLGLV